MNSRGDVVILTFGITTATWLIVGTLLGRAGITSVISRHLVNKPPEVVRINLLIGTGMAVIFGSEMIPTEHRQVGDTVLLPLAGCILLAALVQFLIPRRKRGSGDG